MIPTSLARVAATAAALFALAAAAVSCGGEAQTAGPPKAAAPDLDADPLGLLPPGAIAVATIDARGIFDSPALGASAGKLAQSLSVVPSGTGVSPGRDVDRIVLGIYGLSGADTVLVLQGRFDSTAIERAVQARAPAGTPGALTSAPYAGRTLYTQGQVSFAVLTPRTVVAGTGAGPRNALDRIQAGRVRPELSPAMVGALRTPRAIFAFAGDFTGTPISGLRGVPVPPWASGLKTVQATATLEGPGIQVAALASFDTPQAATSASDGVRSLGALLNSLAATGVVPQLQGLSVAADGTTLKIGFALDAGQVRSVLTRLPEWMGSPG